MQEQTLGDLMVELWRGRLFVLGGLVVGVLCAVAFIYAAVPHYRASMILSPASPMGAISVAAGSQGSVQDKAVSVAADGALFTRFEAMYKGGSVAQLLLRNEMVLDGLERDRGFVFSKGNDDWDAAKLAEYIGRRVVVDPVGETNLRRFYYDHVDAKFAAAFVQQIHATTDGLIRYAMRRDVNERIEYLQKALGEVKNPDHRRGLTDLLMEQERLKMLVSINQAYAASVVEPSATMSRIFWPNKSLVFAGFMGVGALIGFVVFSVMHPQKAALLTPRKIVDVQTPPGASKESRDLAERSRQKMRDWMRRDSGNSNEKILAPQKTSKAVE